MDQSGENASRFYERRRQPDYTDAEGRDLFEIWHDHYRARRDVDRQALIERMPELVRQRDALVKQMPDMTAPEQVAAGLHVLAIANEIAESYARIEGRDRPTPLADAVGVTLKEQMLDAAIAMVIAAVRDRPDEVAAAVDKLAAEYGPSRINVALDAVEQRLRRRLPDAIRDAARAVEQFGHA